MNTASSVGRENNTEPVRKRKSGSFMRFMRFIRGLCWTLLGLAALVVLLAVLGMIIPPPRDPKAAALDSGDFGLGFKVGDKWDPTAFEAAIKRNGIRFIRDDDITSEGFLSANWTGRYGFLSLQVSATPKGSTTMVEDIMLSVYVPFDLDKKKSLLENYGIAARVAGRLYPMIETEENITMGVDEKAVVDAYGKPLIRMTMNEEGNGPFLIYATDRQLFSFCFSDGSLSDMTAMAPTASKYINRLLAWLYFMASPAIEAFENRQVEITPPPEVLLNQAYLDGMDTDGK
jgi:hypothetical protein